jgi:hypothetical protein
MISLTTKIMLCCSFRSHYYNFKLELDQKTSFTWCEYCLFFITRIFFITISDPLDRSKLVNYLARLRFVLSTYSILANILNADETPMLFDMVGSKTLDFIGT